jgi:hypothetical protein
LVEGLHTHRPRIHAKGSAEVSGNPVHPFKPSQPCLARDRRELLELDADTCGDLVAGNGGGAEAPTPEMNDHARESAVPDDQVGPTPHDHYGNSLVMTDAHQFGKALLSLRLPPKTRRASDPHGRVFGKRLAELDDPGSHCLKKAGAHGKLSGQEGSSLVDVACPKREDEIPLAQGGSYDRTRRGNGWSGVDCRMTRTPRLLHDRPRADPGNRGFASRIDGGDMNQIRITECIPEFLAQCGGTGITVRLEKNDESLPFGKRCSGGCKGCSNLRGMVPVIVKDPELRIAVFEFEAAFGSAE